MSRRSAAVRAVEQPSARGVSPLREAPRRTAAGAACTDDQRSLTGDAYELVRRSILRGQYPPGTVLGFEAVASELGMSKTPVRLALHELAGEGFLEWRRQRRLHVIEPTPDLRRKALELRIRLEEIAVARACALPGDSHVEQLRRELGRQRSADGRTRVELEEDFHLEIARAAGLPLLADVLRTAVGLTLLAGWNDGDASSSFSEHEALVDAIARRDAPGARAVLAKHLCIAHDGARQPATACG